MFTGVVLRSDCTQAAFRIRLPLGRLCPRDAPGKVGADPLQSGVGGSLQDMLHPVDLGNLDSFHLHSTDLHFGAEDEGRPVGGRGLVHFEPLGLLGVRFQEDCFA